MKKLIAILLFAVLMMTSMAVAEDTEGSLKLEAKKHAYLSASMRHLIKMDAALEAATDKEADTTDMKSARNTFSSARDKLEDASADELKGIHTELMDAAKSFRDAAKAVALTKVDVKEKVDAALETKKDELNKLKADRQELKTKAMEKLFDRLLSVLEKHKTRRESKGDDTTDLANKITELEGYKTQFRTAMESGDETVAKEAMHAFKKTYNSAKTNSKNAKLNKAKELAKTDFEAAKKQKIEERAKRKAKRIAKAKARQLTMDFEDAHTDDTQTVGNATVEDSEEDEDESEDQETEAEQ